MDAFLYTLKFSANPSCPSNIRTAKLWKIRFLAGGRNGDEIMPKVTELVEYKTQTSWLARFGDVQGLRSRYSQPGHLLSCAISGKPLVPSFI